MIFDEDNMGFVNFPYTSREILRTDSGKTLIYMISFNANPKDDDMSNVNIFRPGVFISDDVNVRPKPEITPRSTIEDIINQNNEQDFYESIYFPNDSDESWKKLMSFDMISAVCVGWANHTYELNGEIGFWHASFRDLTNEGKKLYYSLRKLHNNKEIRILTFNISS